MVLKSGRYKDQDIREVPSHYLGWLVSKAEETIRDCQAELQRRLVEINAETQRQEARARDR
jgi:hypothetical protein